MAIYHLHVKSVSRGSGSARAKSDYIAREGKYQADLNEVAYCEHGHMPKWAEETPKEYWKAADDYERANGRLFVHVEFSLPIELGKKQREELAKEFCQKLALTSQGQRLPYSMAIHKGRGENNPHCHLMINERINDEIDRRSSDWFRRANPKDSAKGGAQKADELRSREWLRNTRIMWDEMANSCLKKHGHEIEIDHRTLAAQGIDREPQYHLGPAAAAMERKNHSKGKAREPITDRGAEHQSNLKIAIFEKELEDLLKQKEAKTSEQASRERIESGKADALAKFEKWKSDQAAKKLAEDKAAELEMGGQKEAGQRKGPQMGGPGR